ncbi:acetyltransferase [Streptomyces roseirectus]|uniref:Lysine N-acyltransferase MbtK n=1 Tax=Streptomyces roseirectus TaxID=2768066 RepID=A0A7H0IG49_9ACTN|nr:GNAT family N-acetyltransferase [Streptomyces roseirectus]QNP71765.1 acetyltransferase [Streptomyces roseirectus]
MYVHEQPVPGFGTVRIRPLDPVGDVRTVHTWVSERRAEFWGMTGLTEPQVTEIYAHMATLDTHHAFLAELDGTPVALFQLYDPAADRVGECYDVQDGDAGVHVLLAPGERQPGWSAALLGAYAAYVFLTLGRRRVVVDPDPRNEKAVARFLRQGFEAGPLVTLPEVDLSDVHLPAKPARLAFLRREVAFPG